MGVGQYGLGKRIDLPHLELTVSAPPPTCETNLVLLQPEAKGNGSGLEICTLMARCDATYGLDIWPGWSLGRGLTLQGLAVLKDWSEKWGRRGGACSSPTSCRHHPQCVSV